MAHFPLVFLIVSIAAGADNVPPSRINPGNFPVDKVPQFVCLGSDDNYAPGGFKWLTDALKAKVNKAQPSPQPGTFDGTPARASFYVNTNNGGVPTVLNITSGSDANMKKLVGYFKDAIADGHEIGDHTRTHSTSSTTTLAGWTSEIGNVLADLGKVGIDRNLVVGFRTPFLAYNDNTFKALGAMPQFRYDASIESGFDNLTDGGNFVWPYTLDSGPYPADIATVPPGVTIGPHGGLWEVPVYCVIVPPALRHQVWAHRTVKVKDSTYTSVFDTVTGKVVGMDYNILSGPGNYGGLGFDSAEFASTLKHSLDLRLKGNRAPFCFTLHSNIFYDDGGWADEGNTDYNGYGAKSPKATVKQARGALLDFINYALSKPEVRVITQENLVKWCAKPVAFASAVGTRHPERISLSGITVKQGPGTVAIAGLPETGGISVALFTLSGKRLAHILAYGPTLVWKPGEVPPGAYMLRLRAGTESRSEAISIE